MITEYEKTKAIQHTEDLASLLINNPEGVLYYKVFANFISKINPGEEFQIKESYLYNTEEMKKSLSEILKYVISKAAEAEPQKFYTTGELAKFFGVSITSINNWIKENRFIGIERSVPKKHVRIPENTLWRSSNGELIPVKKIVEMWENEHLIHCDLSKEDELSLLQKEINFFEKKYGGSFEKTLKFKEKLTKSELLDKEEWEYLLQRISQC